MGEYIVSARKYRPMTFDSVVGQQALTTTLKNTIKSGTLAHSYLFCGPRGVGKTTCARIFAKAINCTNLTPDGEACNECESCKAFNEGRSLNIFELDAASNNSVQDIRDLILQTRVPPQSGRYKVLIIDEVHMLSQAAFNAFLKTLEEPPAHVIFILATTEKQKILPTILSRCQIYDFERMTVQGTVDHLKHVAEKEGIAYFPDAPTQRGVKHIYELMKAKAQGYEAYLAFVVQMEGIQQVLPNRKTHPEFAQAYQEAVVNGVQVVTFVCGVREDCLWIDKGFLLVPGEGGIRIT